MENVCGEDKKHNLPENYDFNKARKLFTSVDDYYMHTRYTEQMYLNLQLSNPKFNVTELDWTWNSLATRQWPANNPKGKFQHFINSSKFNMPRML